MLLQRRKPGCGRPSLRSGSLIAGRREKTRRIVACCLCCPRPTPSALNHSHSRADAEIFARSAATLSHHTRLARFVPRTLTAAGRQTRRRRRTLLRRMPDADTSRPLERHMVARRQERDYARSRNFTPDLLTTIFSFEPGALGRTYAFAMRVSSPCDLGSPARYRKTTCIARAPAPISLESRDISSSHLRGAREKLSIGKRGMDSASATPWIPSAKKRLASSGNSVANRA